MVRTSESVKLAREVANYEAPTTEDEWHARHFIDNVTEARANGFDVACVECGVGIYDESDAHETWCKLGREE